MLDVRRLRVLLEVARRGSLAGAADRLSYTPSAVSQQIAALEREAGTALLERRARGVVLTEAGQVLVEHAEVVLRALDAAENALAALAELRRGHLRMASFATAAGSVLPPAIDVFRARHPGVELTVGQASPTESVARLREGRIDLALTVDLEAHPAEGVDVIHLFDDPVQLALHRDHPLAAKPDLGLQDLAEETWIDVPRTTSGGQVLTRACTAAGFVPRVRFESDDYAVIQQLVGAGAGVALLPELALRRHDAGIALRPIAEAPIRRAIFAVTRAADGARPSAQALVAAVRNAAAALPQEQGDDDGDH